MRRCCTLHVWEVRLVSDVIDLLHRQPPWKPTHHTEVVAEYQYYDMPLSGVLRQGDREYLFICLSGADKPLSLWWYVGVTQEQRERLESCTPETFDDALHLMDFEGWSRLAFATEHVGIVDFEDCELSGDGPETALAAMQARLDELSREGHSRELTPA